MVATRYRSRVNGRLLLTFLFNFRRFDCVTTILIQILPLSGYLTWRVTKKEPVRRLILTSKHPIKINVITINLLLYSPQNQNVLLTVHVKVQNSCLFETN